MKRILIVLGITIFVVSIFVVTLGTGLAAEGFGGYRTENSTGDSGDGGTGSAEPT